jgi:hypothetical protein
MDPIPRFELLRDILPAGISLNAGAKVAELADAPDLGSGTERCGGSSPPFRTKEAISNQQSAGAPKVTSVGLSLKQDSLVSLDLIISG